MQRRTFESKGFMEAAMRQTFPLRDHKAFQDQTPALTDLRTGKSFSIPTTDIVAKGTDTPKNLIFLKETYGDIPSDLPYA